MPARQYVSDLATAVLSTGGPDLATGALSLTVVSNTGFPTSGSFFTVEAPTGEHITVTSGIGTTTWGGLIRGDNGTTSKIAALPNGSILKEIFGVKDANNFVQVGDAALTNVRSIKKTGAAALTGDVTLTPGANVTLTQSGNDISIAATGGGGGGSGTVTSVGLSLPADFTITVSPVTGAGTLTATWTPQSANAVLIGPITGSPASPTMRLLTGADLPAATTSTRGAVTLASVTPTADGVGAVGGSTAAARADHVHPLTTTFTAEVTVPDLKVTGLTGSVQASRIVGATASGAPLTGPHLVGDASLSLADGKWYVCTVAGTPGTFISAAGSGTVTSVGLTVPGALLGVSGSPITGSGTLAVSLLTQSANSVLAGPTSGSPATPTMRALTAADVPAAVFSWTTKTANYTITTSDSGIAVDATSGNITITLPTAVGAAQAYAIKRIDASANTVTIATTSAQTIDGFSTIPLVVQDQAVVVASTNANWLIEASFYPNPDTTRGDLTVTNAAGALARLGVGANKTVLGSNGTDPGYVALDLSYLGQSTASIGQIAQWSGTAWVPVDAPSGVVYAPVTSGAEPMELISDGAGHPVLAPFM